jgi:hypothetical protein
MLRAWGNRSDTAVWDEPLYAHWLSVTGKQHPGRDVVLAAHAHECDADAVVRRLQGPIPEGRAIWYQKHIAQHLLPEIDRSWLDQVQCAFLIRHPARMLASLWKRFPNATLGDTGLPTQLELFERVKDQTGFPPPVVDSDAIRTNPECVLAGLCSALRVPFDEAMLKWPTGVRSTDGAWSPYWYDIVHASTCFSPPPRDALPCFNEAWERDILEAALDVYDQLATHCIQGL